MRKSRFSGERREGVVVNYKRVRRVYREEGLAVRRRRRKRVAQQRRVLLAPATGLNERWSMDFMGDSLADGRTFRTFNLVDDSRVRRRPSSWITPCRVNGSSASSMR